MVRKMEKKPEKAKDKKFREISWKRSVTKFTMVLKMDNKTARSKHKKSWETF